ncbi:EamA family transporter [Actinomadura welshii]
MLAIALALGAALGWGSSDFLGGLKTRRLPQLSVMLISQATALAALTVFVTAQGAGPPADASLGWAAAAGLAETVGIAALYRGLAVGTMSVVAPVAAAAPVVPLLAGLAIGEIPGPVQFAGVAAILVGLAFASRAPGGDGTGPKTLPSVLYGLLAAGGFGTFFITMDAASEDDVGWALLTARLTAITAIVVIALALRHRPAVPRADVPHLMLIGALIVAADALYATASTQGLVGIVAILGSLHTVVTIALARIFLHERLERWQLAGVAAALAGVLAVSAA